MTDTPEQTRKCSNCMWWDENPLVPDLGECRGAPPHPSPDGYGHFFPKTDWDDWCGSFRMKEPGQ